MAEAPDLSFEGTFRPGTRVRPEAEQWEPFGGVDDARADALMAVFQRAAWETPPGFDHDAVDRALVLSIPEEEPAGVRYSAGYGREALFAAGEEALRLVSMYPSDMNRDLHWFQLDSVDMADNRLEYRANGRLLTAPDAAAEGPAFSWFVLDPVWMRHLLRKGRFYQISLAGLCYACRVAEPYQEEVAVTPAMRRAWEASGIPELQERARQENLTIDMSELRTLLPDKEEGGRADDCRFRGKLLSVRKMRAPVADCLGWHLKVEVLELKEQPIVLTFTVPESVWESDAPPKRGCFVEGWAWMQGRIRNVLPAPGEF